MTVKNFSVKGLIWYILTQCYVNAVVFLNEHKFSELTPIEDKTGSYFGVSVAYQKTVRGRFIIGAPKYDLIGKVFECPVLDLFESKTIKCDPVDIDVEKLASDFSREYSEDLQFHLGVSIAATSDYFLTCAPLWSAMVNKTDHAYTVQEFGVFGTCFVYNGTAYRYNGPFEQYPLKTNWKQAYGGIGWSTLLDEENGEILIARSPVDGDVTRIPVANPLNYTQSLSSKMNRGRLRNAKHLKDMENIGYAMASGKFFADQTIYAISMRKFGQGVIQFIDSNHDIVLKSRLNAVSIENKEVGTMFGTALCAADINRDGFTDLFVGAPAYADDDSSYDIGAVYIYLGGNKLTINNEYYMIEGAKEKSRFGSAIVATDLDGDAYPEIFISAPYENSGVGALYILFGHEVNRVINKLNTKPIQLSTFKWMQRIQYDQFKSFGYTLQVIPDQDGNGCSELAVGAPESAKVVVLPCMPAVNITVVPKLFGTDSKKIKTRDENVTVEVCLAVEYPDTLLSMSGRISVKATITGDAYIPQPAVATRIKSSLAPSCVKYQVLFRNFEPGIYTFTAQVIIEDVVTRDYFPNIVTMSPHSVTEANLELSRSCEGEDCTPDLSLSLQWSGGNSSYVLGSSETELAVIDVHNEGNSSYGSCLWFKTTGALLSRVECLKESDRYYCPLPSPLRRKTHHKITVEFNMTKVTNEHDRLTLDVELLTDCNPENKTRDSINVPYIFPTETVSVHGISHNLDISDRDILNKATETITGYEYLVINNGSITWNVVAVVTMEKKQFLSSSKMSVGGTKCSRNETEFAVSFTCDIMITPQLPTRIIATTEIIKDQLMSHMVEGKLNMSSNIRIHLTPTLEIKTKSLTNIITLQKEMTIAQNKDAMIIIAVIVAVLVLGVTTLIMYKCNFLKRKEKERLHELKRSIRKRTIRRESEAAERAKAAEDGDKIELEVVDDYPFDEPIPFSSDDESVLIGEEKAQVHKEKE